MNTEKRLQEIWSQDYIDSLPESIKQRRFIYSENDSQKDILITGINASFRNDDKPDHNKFVLRDIFEEKYDNYWGPIKKILHNEHINLQDKAAYLDIFYFREKDQRFLKELLTYPQGIRFIVEQLNLTQHLIEDVIKPKVIIVKNRESAAYWGRFANEEMIWMGYQLEFVRDEKCGQVYKITGLINSSERIAPEIKQTNLQNTLVLFTEHITQYTTKEKRPTAWLIKTLLDDFCCG